MTSTLFPRRVASFQCVLYGKSQLQLLPGKNSPSVQFCTVTSAPSLTDRNCNLTMAVFDRKGSALRLHAGLFDAPKALLVPRFSNQGFFCSVFQANNMKATLGGERYAKVYAKFPALILVGDACPPRRSVPALKFHASK